MPSVSITSPVAAEVLPPVERALLDRVVRRSARESAALLKDQPDVVVARILGAANPGHTVDILENFPLERRRTIAAATPMRRGEQWLENAKFPSTTIGRLMERPLAVFQPSTTVGEAITTLEGLVKRAFITYGFVVDAAAEAGAARRLVGVLAFRELLFARRDQTLAEIMIERPFAFRPDTKVVDAMHEAAVRHYPAYPVTDAAGRFLGIVRGQALFEREAFEISSQAGAMVGVEKEERVTTPWWPSFRSRHPWLQINLLTAFLASAVVGQYQETIDRYIVLALFLGILSGQCANTGAQALAVTLRGMTLGDLRGGMLARLGWKEAWVGLFNGIGTGLIAGIGMYLIATYQKNDQALVLGLVVFLALFVSCVVSGIAGCWVPLAMKRLGADPATASAIFVTTVTDCVSMGSMLAFAAMLLPAA